MSNKPKPSSKDEAPKPSWGNISEHHWSRARKGTNQEAIDYYRDRSHAPGVEAGGSERNFYCMHCDGVIPHEEGVERCPHCGAELDDRVRRYFNWVELDQPGSSDLRALLPFALGGLVLVGGLVALAILAWGWGTR